MFGVPAASSLAVFRKLGVGKEVLVFLARNAVAYITAKAFCQFSRGARANHIATRVFAQHIRRKATARNLRLAMLRRAEKHKAVNFALHDSIKLTADFMV